MLFDGPKAEPKKGKSLNWGDFVESQSDVL